MRGSSRQSVIQDCRFIGLAICALLLTVRVSAATGNVVSKNQAQPIATQGRADHAWHTEEVALRQLTDPRRFDALLKSTATYRARTELPGLAPSSASAATRTDGIRLALRLSAFSDDYLLSRQLRKAKRLAQESVAIARQLSLLTVLAATLNQLGNVIMAQQQHQEAITIYGEALRLAEQTTDEALIVKVSINVAHGQLATRDLAQAGLGLESSLDKARALPDAHDKLFSLVALGHLAQRLARLAPLRHDTLLSLAYAAFSDALVLAQALQSLRGKSYAIGHIAELYTDSDRLVEAQRLFHQALFFAEEAAAPELLARWHRQLGRLHKLQGSADEAIAAYREALKQLRVIQAALVFGHRGYPGAFRDDTGQIYRELAELLLEHANNLVDPVLQRTALRKIRDVMEEYKAVELENYFQDHCVTAQQEKNRSLDLDSLIKPGTATLYPVVFDDRIVLLLSLANGDIRFATTPVEQTELRLTANGFRQQMRPGSNPRRLLKQAQQLYQWLIRPIESDLKAERIDTLVVVPDGVLRTLPFAALHDGKDYLLSRLAIVISPSLLLTDTSDSTWTDSRLLINGLAEGVQGYTPLPHVRAEVAGLASKFQSTQLIDAKFVKADMVAELERTPYGIISFSTHGYFDSDPAQSFLLTYDDKLSLDELERFLGISKFRDQPVEMLVLSACDTAIGDERAALGLAGIALKSGARSAMASLWSVSDESTAELVPVFFDNLKNKQSSKAKALQQAQLTLLNRQRTKHPFYWAPFVLIGNWF